MSSAGGPAARNRPRRRRRGGGIPLDRRALCLAFAGATTGTFTVNPNSVPRSETGLASAVIATQRSLGRNIGTAPAALVPSLHWLATGAGASPSISAPAAAPAIAAD